MIIQKEVKVHVQLHSVCLWKGKFLNVFFFLSDCMKKTTGEKMNQTSL